MSKKAVNWLFLVFLLAEIGITLLILLTGIRFSIIFALILNQLIFLIPALIFLIITKTKISEMVPHKRLHPVTPLLCIIFTGLCIPLITVVNMISQLFVENEVTQLASRMLDIPGWLMILVIGVFGPINEEFLFRGTFYGSYRKTGRILAAMFLSAFLFGLIHLNFNQMSYAIVVGILAVLLVEATGSIVSSMIFHVTINTENVILMLLQRNTIASGGGDPRAMVEELLPGMSYMEFMMIAICIYGMVAIITTILAMLLAVGISYIEKRNVEFFSIFKLQKKSGGGKRQTLWSIPLGIAVVFSFIYMIVDILPLG